MEAEGRWINRFGCRHCGIGGSTLGIDMGSCKRRLDTKVAITRSLKNQTKGVKERTLSIDRAMSAVR